MKVVYKKPKVSHFNLKLYKGIKNMELIRIFPKIRIKSNVSEVKVKISPKKYSKPRTDSIYYNMKVYFSPMLLNELSWSKENCIAVFKDAKNINNYFLKIAEDDKGFKINNNKSIYCISFSIDKNIEKYNEIAIAGFEITDGGLKIIL